MVFQVPLISEFNFLLSFIVTTGGNFTRRHEFGDPFCHGVLLWVNNCLYVFLSVSIKLGRNASILLKSLKIIAWEHDINIDYKLNKEKPKKSWFFKQISSQEIVSPLKQEADDKGYMRVQINYQ